jgi:hydroxymethylpyrimidine pyrophosphatase-like HAD family hydrolase
MTEPADDWSPELEAESGGAGPDPLLVPNLLGDLDALSDLLAREIRREAWLDSFLLAAGINQVAEDYLDANAISRRRVARYLHRVAPGPVGSVAAAAVRTFDAGAWGVRSVRPGERNAAAWQRRAGALVDSLADAVVMPPSAGHAARLAAPATGLLDHRLGLPARLRRSIVRVPSCFRNFDQHPADIERLTYEFTRRWPDRSRDIVVVGVRTSGSYTAPLHGAHLRAHGYEKVRVITVRPGQRWRRRETDSIASLVRLGGLALVSDDPPKSGGSVAGAALELEKLGLPARSIILLLQTLGETTSLPDRLQQYASVVVQWPEWSVQQRLAPQAVRQTLGDMLGPEIEVRAVDRVPLPAPERPRGHVHARYRVEISDRSRAGGQLREVQVQGVGLGYFGEHAIAVARVLTGFLPQLIGFKDGLLYRQWLPEESRLEDIATEDVGHIAERVVDYAVARSTALPVTEDFSLRLIDRGAVWQRAGDILARGFGRAAQLVRPLSHPLAKRLLHVARPSVIDGRMDVKAWFREGPPERLLKIDFAERAFNSLDVYCYDHVFDVAGLAPGTSDPKVAAIVGETYHQRTGGRIDPERWLLYRLIHVMEQHRDEPEQRVDIERALAREMQQYYRDALFAGIEVSRSGALCAFDVDWSLETRSLGFPALTPAGAFALHALARHGYRVCIATGRSIDEVRERCRAYGLTGGVAEYGAASYEAGADRVRDLLTREDHELLAWVRQALSATPGIAVDTDYTLAVRAYRFDSKGRRRGVGAEVIESVLRADGPGAGVRAIPGAYQTDFMVNTIDKSGGLRTLATDLRVEALDGRLFALAVGDSAEDLPMMMLARLALAPANSEPAVRAAGIRILARAGPRGLAQAAAELIGHPPGKCAQCRVHDLPDRSRLMLTALAAQDEFGLGKAVQALRLARALATARL